MEQLIGWEKSVGGSMIMKIESGYVGMGRWARRLMACDLVGARQWHVILWMWMQDNDT